MKELDDIAEEAARELFPNYADVSFSRLIIRSAIDKAIEVVLTRAAGHVPVLPGEMPDEMWEVISTNRDVATESLRILVRQTIAEFQAALLAEIKGEGK